MQVQEDELIRPARSGRSLQVLSLLTRAMLIEASLTNRSSGRRATRLLLRATVSILTRATLTRSSGRRATLLFSVSTSPHGPQSNPNPDLSP